MTARALILDFGGVVTRTLFETHRDTERALGLVPHSLTWRGPFAPDTDPLWQSMQRGEISEREYWLARAREVGELVGEDWRSVSEFIRRARHADPQAVIRPETLQMIQRAKRAGLALAILSNELDLFYGAEFRSRLPWLVDFDLICDATYTGVLKPAPEAYLACLSQLGLPASRCVFVDDQCPNLVGAEAVGLQTVRFDVLRPAASCAAALDLLGLRPLATRHNAYA